MQTNLDPAEALGASLETAYKSYLRLCNVMRGCRRTIKFPVLDVVEETSVLLCVYVYVCTFLITYFGLDKYLSSWFDYCLYSSLCELRFRIVQIVQKVTARKLTETRKSFFLPTMAFLHFLSIKVGADCQVPLQSYNALNCVAASYLCHVIQVNTLSSTLH